MSSSIPVLPPFVETHIIGEQTRERIAHQGTCPELAEYGISCMGISDALFPYRMVRFDPDFEHLLVCTGGKGRVWVNNRWEYCGPGETYLARAHQFHAFCAVPKQRWQFAWVLYKGMRPWHKRLPGSNSKGVGEPHALSVAVEGLYREIVSGSSAEARVRWAGLIDFYWKQITEGASKPGRLLALWKRVDQNLAHPWTVDELTRIAGLSNEQLRRVAKHETGRSPIEHVTWLRINRAMALLQSTPLKIQAVAEAVGYSNQFAFSAAFRRWAGCPPSRFRSE